MSEALIVIKPGDRVLVVTARDDIGNDEILEMQGTLAARFPGVEFTFLVGVAQVARMEDQA